MNEFFNHVAIQELKKTILELKNETAEVKEVGRIMTETSQKIIVPVDPSKDLKKLINFGYMLLGFSLFIAGELAWVIANH